MAISDSPINRYPASLLGFLDVKAMGNNPRFLEPNVRPILDLRPFYMAGSRIARSETVNIGSGLVLFPTLTVPQNKAWQVEFLSVTGPGLVATEVMYGAPAILPQASTGGIMYGPKTAEVGDANSPTFIAAWDLINRPIVCAAGCRFGVMIYRLALLGVFQMTLTLSLVETDL